MLIEHFQSSPYRHKDTEGRFILVCYSQAGASHGAYSLPRLQREVWEPTELLFVADEIDFVAITTPVNSKFPGAELPEYEAWRNEEFVISPTHILVRQLWKSDPCTDGLVLVTDSGAKTVAELIASALDWLPAGASVVHTVEVGASVPEFL
jgi:hypothetical protein